MSAAIFAIATVALAQYGALAAPSRVDDGVCAVQMMVEKKEAETPTHIVMPATNTTPTLSCPTKATIYNYDVTFDYQLLYTGGEVSGATFTYTLTPTPSPQYSWRNHDKIKWWMPRCTCDITLPEFVKFAGEHEYDIGFTDYCDDSDQPAYLKFKNIAGYQKKEVYKAQYTMTSSKFMIGSVFMEIDPSYSVPHTGSICGPVCGFDLECVDSPNPWQSKGGQGCGHYAQNQWCTQSGDYGPNWNPDWGTFSTYAPTGGQGADEACCVCGGGSIPGCKDEPAGWEDTYHEGCGIYEKKDYCTYSGGKGPGWNSKWGDFGKWAKDGIDATEACCTCGGGKAPAPGPTKNPTKRPTVSPTKKPTPAPTASTPSPTGSKDDCEDDPADWKDSYHEGCDIYEKKDYCTSTGGFGTGWNSKWGKFDNWAKKGIDATEACCTCGGGKNPGPGPTPAPTVLTPSPTVADDDCVDDPSDWKDSVWEGCDIYEKRDYCTSSGGFGTGWNSKWGEFEKWAKKGVDATQACCTCGGGKGSPTKKPTAHPTKKPTPSPTGSTTPSPTTASPTAFPTRFPTTASPTESPTPSPTESPTPSPTASPTASPTPSPTASPTASPTPSPTASPTESPTPSPTASPTAAPTPSPTASPTESPTPSPTASPTAAPTPSPTASPTESPTPSPTASPTAAPTPSPTASPTESPTPSPTASPTESPTPSPTAAPTPSPTPSPPTPSPPTPMPTCGPCVWPPGTLDYSVITKDDATINANISTKMAIGGSLFSTNGDVLKTAGGEVTVGGSFPSTGWNFSAGVTQAPLDSVLDFKVFEDLAMRLMDGDYGGDDFCIKVIRNVLPAYDLGDFFGGRTPLGSTGENNGRTLAVFTEPNPFTLEATPFGSVPFGLTVLAPFASVSVDPSSTFADGLIIAKSAHIFNQEVRGEAYRGPLACSCGVW